MTPHEIATRCMSQLEDAVVMYLQQKEDGATNADVTRDLELESDFEGQQKNYLAWSILGRLISRGRVRYEKRDNHRRYFATEAR